MQRSPIHDPLSQSLNHLGTPNFLRAIVSYIHTVVPSFPVDPVILQSILLCLLAGGKHLILRTSEDDISLVMKIAVKTLTTLFGVPTHKLRIRSKEPGHPGSISSVSPYSFLRSLFLPPSTSIPAVGSSGSIYNSQDDSSTITGRKVKKRHRKRVSSRSRSRPTTGQSRASQFSRSVSFPNEPPLPKSFHSTTSSNMLTSDPFGDHPAFQGTQTRFIPSNPFASVKSSYSLASPTLPHSHSDPTPLRLRETSVPQLPRAIVMSGLENASLLSQRALITVLAERKVVLEGPIPDDGSGADIESGSRGTRRSRSIFESKDVQDHDIEGVWPLPDDFLLIYVCSMNEWERPDVHKSLLDRFSMSATVTLQPSVRATATTLFRPLSFRGSPVLSPVPLGSSHAPTPTPAFFSQALPARQWSPSIQAAANNASPLINSDFMEILRDVYAKVHFPPALNLYLSDLFSAARNHPQLEGRLLTAVSIKEAYDLCRAWRVLSGDPTGMELVQDVVLGEEDEFESLNNGDDAENTPGSVMNALEGVESGNVSMNGLAPHLEVNGDASLQQEEFTVPVLEITQSDIGRIAPRVISHRVRVRGGPQEEVLASAMYGAALNSFQRNDARELGLTSGNLGDRDSVTVKDILIGILQEV
ncbi:hypothetical protein V5O48_000132 [Marasmius crinis-equi]|uniref:Uncharacterized protein n=1 Tax=Marasmius crinis-equi TaxID=585013 RepID=A0ABR3G2J3_9AGAR